VPADDRTAAHISSPQWQSFEMRMRARRAERCLQRAAGAIENGTPADAREALDEVRILNPTDPRVPDLETRLAELDGRVAASSGTELRSPERPIADVFTASAIVGAPPVPDLELPLLSREPQPASNEPELVSPTAFEPVLDFDRIGTTPLEGWSGLALAPPSRQWTRVTGILAFSVLVSALIGWQTWAHRDLIPAMPSAQPDVDARTGLAAGPPQLAGIAPGVARETTPSPISSSQPNPQPVEQPVSTSSPNDNEVVASPSAATVTTNVGGSDPTGTKGTPAIIPLQSAQLTALAGRETAPPANTPSRIPARQPESLTDAPVSENRPTASPTAPALPVTTPPPPISTPAATAAASPAAREESSVIAPVNTVPLRPEPPPSIPTAPSASSSSLTFGVRDQSAGVRAALSRYETAYSKLDVEAVHSVWPSLDERALMRAFEGLSSQRVSLGSCTVDVNGNAARADCAGTAAWTPKVGGGERTTSRKWTFDLTESDGTWRIVRVQAR